MRSCGTCRCRRRRPSRSRRSSRSTRIDPLQIAEGYYLQPDGPVAAKPYKLLVQTLSRSSRVAIAKYAWSGRERLGRLRIRGEAIVLHAMRWPDEIRSPAELFPPAVDLSDEEIDEAVALIDGMTIDDLEGEEFRDQYTEALEQVIEAKREGHALPEALETEEPGKVLDLMAALKESVAKAKSARGEDVEDDVHELPKKKAAVKTSTARKQPAEKTAANNTTKKTKKTTAKKTARRSRSA